MIIRDVTWLKKNYGDYYNISPEEREFVPTEYSDNEDEHYEVKITSTIPREVNDLEYH